MTDLITIPEASTVSGVTYYHISIKLPLRSFTTKRRYSEFQDLVYKLSGDLGINVSDFPYQLPSKRIKWFKGESVVEERKELLVIFLNSIVRDLELQNNPLVHNFLLTPVNFKFNNNMFKPKDKEFNLNIELEGIDDDNWLEVYRSLKSGVDSERTSEDGILGSNIADKIQTINKINRVFQPCLVNLTKSLDSSKLVDPEKSRRQTILRELQGNLDQLLLSLDPKEPTNSAREFGKSRRVFGQPVETKETISLNNNELLQQQTQIHKQQDHEVEQLRKIIQRQRQIGQAIHTEVEEQNNLLDQFNEEVDVTTGKLKEARRRAKKIL